MREYWAREAEMMRDKSGVLGNKQAFSPVDFNSSVNSAVNKLIASGLAFGLNLYFYL